LPRQARDKHARKEAFQTTKHNLGRFRRRRGCEGQGQAGKKTRLLASIDQCHFMVKMPSFCQDRLGTNIGKSTQKRGLRFVAGGGVPCTVRERVFLRCQFILKIPSFYQDRLGTNTGKPLKTKTRFCRHTCSQPGCDDGILMPLLKEPGQYRCNRCGRAPVRSHTPLTRCSPRTDPLRPQTVSYPALLCCTV
jgi:hypothetical protein